MADNKNNVKSEADNKKNIKAERAARNRKRRQKAAARLREKENQRSELNLAHATKEEPFYSSQKADGTKMHGTEKGGTRMEQVEQKMRKKKSPFKAQFGNIADWLKYGRIREAQRNPDLASQGVASVGRILEETGDRLFGKKKEKKAHKKPDNFKERLAGLEQTKIKDGLVTTPVQTGSGGLGMGMAIPPKKVAEVVSASEEPGGRVKADQLAGEGPYEEVIDEEGNIQRVSAIHDYEDVIDEHGNIQKVPLDVHGNPIEDTGLWTGGAGVPFNRISPFYRYNPYVGEYPIDSPMMRNPKPIEFNMGKKDYDNKEMYGKSPMDEVDIDHLMMMSDKEPHAVFVDLPVEEKSPMTRIHTPLYKMGSPLMRRPMDRRYSPLKRLNSPFKQEDILRYGDIQEAQISDLDDYAVRKGLEGYNRAVRRHNYKRQVWENQRKEAEEDFGQLVVPPSGIQPYDAAKKILAVEWKKSLNDLKGRKYEMDPNEYAQQEAQIFQNVRDFKAAEMQMQELLTQYAQDKDNISLSGDPQVQDLIDTLYEGGPGISLQNIEGIPTLTGYTNAELQVANEENREPKANISIPISEIAKGAARFRYNKKVDVQPQMQNILKNIASIKNDYEVNGGLAKGTLKFDKLQDSALSQIDNTILTGDAQFRQVAADRFGIDYDQYQEFSQMSPEELGQIAQQEYGISPQQWEFVSNRYEEPIQALVAGNLLGDIQEVFTPYEDAYDIQSDPRISARIAQQREARLAAQQNKERLTAKEKAVQERLSHYAPILEKLENPTVDSVQSFLTGIPGIHVWMIGKGPHKGKIGIAKGKQRVGAFDPSNLNEARTVLLSAVGVPPQHSPFKRERPPTKEELSALINEGIADRLPGVHKKHIAAEGPFKVYFDEIGEDVEFPGTPARDEFYITDPNPDFGYSSPQVWNLGGKGPTVIGDKGYDIEKRDLMSVHLPGTKPTSKKEKATIYDYAIKNGATRTNAIKLAEEGLPADGTINRALKGQNPYRGGKSNPYRN